MANSVEFKYPAVFNFGDSNSDTGELAAGLGFLVAPPNGQDYFKIPSGRFCDGRLIVDFLTMASNTCIIRILTVIAICIPRAKSFHLDFPAVFNFGDSNSDTGALIAAAFESLYPPNGQTYFQKPSGRYSDGRLTIDFLMDAMDLPFLNAYLDSLGLPNFRKGCNFAAAAATILPATASSLCPFSFGVQVSQFLRFKARALELIAKGRKFDKYVPDENVFEKGLYMFDIGQNDLAGAFYSKTLDQILASIPTILLELEKGIKNLYDQGARYFWIHNTGPLGCLPQNIAKFGTDSSKLDELGCVSSHNQAAKTFNLQLHALCTKLQGQYPDSNVTYVDIFTIKSNLISNFSRYGFEQPIMACCGYGGPPLNYDSRVSCGETKTFNGTTITAKACNDTSEYINAKCSLLEEFSQVEFQGGCVLDHLYQLYAHYITSFKDDSSGKRDARICKRISFLFSDVKSLPLVGKLVWLGCSELLSSPDSRVLVFSLQCSLNMLEGDTGCSVWPSSLFLSELILSHPELFSNKSCFEIGSGVGLVSPCECFQGFAYDTELFAKLHCMSLCAKVLCYALIHVSQVKCLYLPWESASESQLQDIMPDVVLGADVIYDPVCLPHLVRVLAMVLMNQTNLGSCRQHASCKGHSPNIEHENGEHNHEDAINKSDGGCKAIYNDGSNSLSKEAPVAYIAYVIRNIETFNYFLSLGIQANLDIGDLTDSLKPVNLLCCMKSYNQATVRLLRITCSNIQ
ncbi:hypothetical protein JHK87_008238 [Glycine soja]|nr:hypothetical protein JHK87_008238 [Glycine soja]